MNKILKEVYEAVRNLRGTIATSGILFMTSTVPSRDPVVPEVSPLVEKSYMLPPDTSSEAYARADEQDRARGLRDFEIRMDY